MDKKTLLITGFEPFGGERINPSWEAVCRLPDEIAEYKLTKLQIPTVFGLAANKIIQLAEQIKPKVILCIGQARGRKKITPEVVGINLRECSIADNGGNQPVDQPIRKDGAAAYFSTIPVRKIVKEVEAAGFPCELSYSAGAFVCNDVLYSLLERYKESDILVGFIHVPLLCEQDKEGGGSLPLEEMVKALSIAIEALE